MATTDIRCPGCGKLFAKNSDGVLEVRDGDKGLRIYGSVAVGIDCPRCGKSSDLAVRARVKRVVE